MAILNIPEIRAKIQDFDLSRTKFTQYTTCSWNIVIQYECVMHIAQPSVVISFGCPGAKEFYQRGYKNIELYI